MTDPGTAATNLGTLVTDSGSVIGSVTVILICERSAADPSHLDQLMDQVWDAMVLCVGVDDLANMTNVEKVKRQLKVCCPFSIINCEIV